MFDYSTPMYESARVAEAAGIPINTFRSYFKRGQFRKVGKMDMAPAEGAGLAHVFSLRDAMGFALAARLIAVGVAADIAFREAMLRFAHVSAGERIPAGMFDIGSLGCTLFLYYPASQTGHVVAEEGIKVRDLFWNVPAGHHETLVAILMNDVEHQVFSVLRPQDIAK